MDQCEHKELHQLCQIDPLANSLHVFGLFTLQALIPKRLLV